VSDVLRCFSKIRLKTLRLAQTDRAKEELFDIPERAHAALKIFFQLAIWSECLDLDDSP